MNGIGVSLKRQCVWKNLPVEDVRADCSWQKAAGTRLVHSRNRSLEWRVPEGQEQGQRNRGLGHTRPGRPWQEPGFSSGGSGGIEAEEGSDPSYIENWLWWGLHGTWETSQGAVRAIPPAERRWACRGWAGR